MNNKSRRYALMSLIGLEKYSTVVYNYIYYNLISSYRDSGKMKLAKIEGNGVIENQLVQSGDYGIAYGGTIAVSGNKATISADGSAQVWAFVSHGIRPPVGNKYLCVAKAKASVNCSFWFVMATNYTYVSHSLTTNQETLVSEIITSSSNDYGYMLGIRFNQGTNVSGVTIEISDVELIDLTLMFGTGNEPTTLTDNRIQNLLNRGYIAYNQGEYKGTNVGEIETEPYNLFDEETELGRLDTTTGQNFADNSQLRAKNYIKVIGGQSYTMEIIGGNNTNAWAMFFDENKNVIADVNTGTSVASNARAWNNGVTITMPYNCWYVRFYLVSGYGTTYLNNICLHRTGNRTGYAKHKPSAFIPFIYQGNGALNAHDTFEITSSEYVITKNVGSVDLSNLNFSYQSASSRWYVATTNLNILGVNNASMPNILSEKYEVKSFANANSSLSGLCIGSGNNPTLFLYTSDSSALPSGIITYEIATPQVIRIPRKHLGIVDLGTITTGYVSNGVYYIGGNDQSFGIDVASSNANGYACYCSKFLRANGNEVYSKTNDNTICLTSPFIGNNLAIYSSSFAGKTADEIRTMLSGTYLFYETENEVDDIVYKIKYENGGTVTTDSEVLPNVTIEVQV